MTTPIKTVRIQLPEGHVDRDDSSNEVSDDTPEKNENTANEINIILKTSISSSPEKSKVFLGSKRTRTERSPKSPLKRVSDSSAVTFRLDEELEKAAKRRASEVGMTGLTGGEDNMAQMIVSLRRQNDDLRQKLSDAKELNNKTVDNSGLEKEEHLRKLAEKECEELKTTVSRLERLINIEREERKVTEKQTLELLEDVKKKWHERTEDRVQKMRADLQAANTVVQEMEIDMMKKDSELDKKKQEIENLSNTKASLKAKLKDYHGKLESTVARYSEQVKYIEKLEQQAKDMDAKNVEKVTENQAKNRRVTVTLNEQRGELEEARRQLDQTKEKKIDIEGQLKRAHQLQKSLEQTVKLNNKENEELRKEYDSHRAKCDKHLVNIKSENEKLLRENELLEDKLNGKDSKLSDLEKLLEALENKIPNKDSIDAVEKIPMLEKKLNDQEEIIENLQSDIRLQKVELRVAERKNNEQKERITYLREMYKEEKDKKEKLEAETHSESDKIEKLQKELSESLSECEKLKQRTTSLQERIQKLNRELEDARRDGEKQQEFEARCENLQIKISELTKEVEKSNGFEKQYNVTKNVCYELEDQIKEYERIIEKLEASQDKLTQTNTELKGKTEKSSTEYISAKSQINELKSMLAFKESKIRDLTEKNEESKNFYENEGQRWKSRFEEISAAYNESSKNASELTESIAQTTHERDQANNFNDHLNEQNNKLKEESASLITGIHSLKESNMMLQGSVRDLAAKLDRRDKEIERLKENLKTLDHEHTVTLDQVKKLTRYIPESTVNQPTPQKSKKDLKPFANLLL